MWSVIIRRTHGADRDDGQDSGLLQAQGLRVPEFGDLRRHPLLLRLRSLRRRDEAEHQGGVVAPHGPHARGHGRPRLGHHHAPQSVGGIGAHGDLQRHARREPHQQAPLQGRPPHRGRHGHRRRGPEPRGADQDHRGRRPGQRPRGRWPRLRARQALQPDVRDLHGAGQDAREPRLSAARDGAGDLRQLQERAADQPREGAVRDSAAGQVFPERDHTGQLHLPHPRVRADGDGVLRRTRHRRGVARVLDRRTLQLVPGPRSEGREPPPLRAPAREALPLRQAHRGHRVRLRLRRLVRARRHRQPHRLRPQAARRSTPARTSSTSTRRPTTVTSPTS